MLRRKISAPFLYSASLRGRKRRFPAGGAQQRGQLAHRLGELERHGLAELVDLLVQQLDLELRLDVDLVVALGGLAIDVLLAVPTHHDERGGVGRLDGRIAKQ